ncbi:hypothetical protein [Rhodococcus erythropolis]|uniref:hypothetical protein n=1 Tax=Rhodococcus erythropolis TaxID=1833 RepID=UPI001BE6C4BA|nr:hypothetical protein [Rhodococcus erythropolis]MBT2265885.1 hypothetical protein [Rhodococcus erythropolis]
MPDTTPEGISDRERALAAMRDRRDGMTWDEIAANHGYTGRGTAFRAVKRVLERVEGETAEDYREVMAARYEALYAKAWDSIAAADEEGQLVGKSQLIASARGVVDSQVKLLGLQAVSKSEVTVVTRGQMDAEIEVLLGHGGISAGTESDSDPEENS